MDAEIVQPVLFCIAVANATKLLKLGTAHVEWLQPASCRVVMEEYTFPRKRRNEERRESMMPRLQGKGKEYKGRTTECPIPATAISVLERLSKSTPQPGEMRMASTLISMRRQHPSIQVIIMSST